MRSSFIHKQLLFRSFVIRCCTQTAYYSVKLRELISQSYKLRWLWFFFYIHLNSCSTQPYQLYEFRHFPSHKNITISINRLLTGSLFSTVDMNSNHHLKPLLMSNPEIFSVPPESKNSSMFLSLQKFGFWNIPLSFFFLFSKSLPGKDFMSSPFELRFRWFLFLNFSKFTLYMTISVSPAYPTLWNYKKYPYLLFVYNSTVWTPFWAILSPKFVPPQNLSTETFSNQLP